MYIINFFILYASHLEMHSKVNYYNVLFIQYSLKPLNYLILFYDSHLNYHYCYDGYK